MKNNLLFAMGRQRGASALTMMIMVLFFGGLLTLMLKLGPAYLDDITIQEALEGLEGTEGLSQMGAGPGSDVDQQASEREQCAWLRGQEYFGRKRWRAGGD